MSLIRVFQIVLRGGDRKSSLVEGEWEILLEVGITSSSGGHLRRSAFDHSSLFQSKKHSVNTEHQLKSKLA